MDLLDTKQSIDDDGIQDTVSRITKNKKMDHEEEAFQRRLEKLKANISVELNVPVTNESSEEKDSSEDFHSHLSFEDNNKKEEREKDVNNGALKEEVTELRREFTKLKEAIKNLKNESNSQMNEEESASDNSGAEDTKTINAVDIISREVKTTILSKTKSKTKSTYLIIKAEKKKNLLKSKLIELKNKKRKMTERVTKTSFSTESRQKLKKQKLEDSEEISTDSEDDDMEGNSLMEAIKKRLEKNIRDKNKIFGSKHKKDFKDRRYRVRENSEARAGDNGRRGRYRKDDM